MTDRARRRNRARHRRAVRKHFDAGLPWLEWKSGAPRWLWKPGSPLHPRNFARERHAMSKRWKRNLRNQDGAAGLRPTAWNRWRPDVLKIGVDFATPGSMRFVIAAGRRPGHASGAWPR